MKKMYRINGGLKKSLLLFVVLLLVVNCSSIAILPLSSSPQATTNPPDTSTPPPSPQEPTITPVPPTPTAIIPSKPTSMEWQDQIVYILLPHKFYDGDPTNNYMRDEYDLPNPNYEGGFLGGDIAGIRQKIPYLKSLGITAVLINPMFCNDEKPFFQFLATGYSVRDYQCIDRNFGTVEEFVQLIEELHSTTNGPRINVILDLPISTTSRDHPWTKDSSYYRAWNYENPKDNIGCSENSCEPYIMPDGKAVDHTFAMPILAHTAGMETGTGAYAAIRDTIFWLVDQYDIDGFRYDSAQNFYPAFWVKFLSEFRDRYDETKPDFWHVGEIFIWPGTEKSWQISPEEYVNQTSSVGPIRMDSIYDFPSASFIKDVFAKGMDPNCIPSLCANLLQHLVDPWGVEHPERLMAPLDGYELGTFFDAVQNGNAKEKIFLAFAFVMTINRAPLISSGIEYGIHYKELGVIFAGGFDDTYLENFKKLTQIRQDHPAFRWGSLTDLGTPSNIISYARQYEGETYIVVLNNTAVSQPITINLEAKGISCNSVRNLLLENDQNIQLNNDSLSVTLNAWEAKIIQCEYVNIAGDLIGTPWNVS